MEFLSCGKVGGCYLPIPTKRNFHILVKTHTCHGTNYKIANLQLYVTHIVIDLKLYSYLVFVAYVMENIMVFVAYVMEKIIGQGS
jgi:hypothetical protein